MIHSGSEIRSRYLKFMASKGHFAIPSAALIPDNDSTTLFTGSGMQPLVPYLMGESHPKGSRLTNSQKCFRAEDIEEVGDNRHTTFFEMLGNWSLGDYFKDDQLPWIYEFLVDEIGLDKNRIYVTTFIGDDTNNVPKDLESAQIWQEIFKKRGVSFGIAEIGSEKNGSERGIKNGERIFFYDAGKNWWSRAGKPEKMPVGEIGGPDSEMFYDFGLEHDSKFGEFCHPNCDCGRFIEIGNSVFIEYIKTENGFEKLPNRNVDFGGGLERIAAAAIDKNDVFKVDFFYNTIKQIEELSQKKYADETVAFRVITDHIRGAVFMIGDGILPSNTEQGYFVRRLLRRAIRFADLLGVQSGKFKTLAQSVISSFCDHYTNLKEKQNEILVAIETEETQFRKTLENGLKQFNKIELQLHFKSTVLENGERSIDANQIPKQIKAISAQNAFDLFATYGFPIELTEEIAKEKGLKVDITGFKKLMDEHREKSRAGAEHKFKGGLADHSERVVQYHTTTHLMLAALRHFLGDHVHQAGSNITGERLRFDFTHGEKISPDTIKNIEDWVNFAIKTGGEIIMENITKLEAENDPTIEGSFWDRYPDKVKVYSIKGNNGEIFSRELCGGPHVQRLENIRGVFKIKKEESSSAGVRRIKAVLQD